MDIPAASSKRLRNSEDELNKSTLSRSTDFGESTFDADESLSSNHSLSRSPSISSDTNKDKSKSHGTARPSPSSSSMMPQKKKCVLEVFPWLNDIEKSTQKCLGSITEVKSKTVLNAMDFLLKKLSEDYPKYCKSPRLSNILSRYLREFLYTYRHLYKGFELGKEYFRRITRILAAYTDLELCGSIAGMEWDSDMANRIQLIYRIHLEFAEDFTILDVFINMKRLSRLHRGVLTLLLKHFLVKITVKEPVEVDDDVFVKYFIVFKKWLAIEEISEDKEDIRSAFITQAKPSKTFCMNSKYAPYLPSDENSLSSSNHFVRMLDKKFSLQPLLQALEMSEKVPGMHEPSTSGFAQRSNEVVVLSDDEDDASELQVVTVKTEPEPSETSDNNEVIVTDQPPDLIDLTDEVFEDSEVPRHYISWLTDLIKRATIKPTTMDQRLEEAAVSSDVIVIDDPQESSTNKKSTDESQADKISTANVSTASTHVTHTSSASIDSGCVLSSREEVGIHWNNNFDNGSESCPSSNEVHVDETHHTSDNRSYQHEQTKPGYVISNDDDNSHECNAFNVSSSDGNKPLPLMNIASGSISSCSDEAAEQLLTVTQAQISKLYDRLPSDLIDKVQITKDSTSNRSINKVIEPSDVDCTVESTSFIEPTSSDSLPQQSNLPESTTVYRRIQVVSDKNLTATLDKKYDEIGRHDESASESVSDLSDEHSMKVHRSHGKKTITVVHPTRHKQIPSTDSESGIDYPQDMTSSSSGMKTNSSIFSPKNIDVRCSPQNIERPTRSVHTLIADLTDNGQPVVGNSTSSTPSTRRRADIKPESPVDNEQIPSTIMERKTYIKKTCNKTTSTANRSLTVKPSNQLARSPTSSVSVSAPAPSLSSTTPIVEPRPQITIESQQISPSKTTQTTQHQPYKLFYSDEELPFLTPYDAFMTETEDDQKLLSPRKLATTETDLLVKPKVELTDRQLSYNISEEKLLTAAAQLVDVYNKRTKASATITVQKKSLPDAPRNRPFKSNKQPMRSSLAMTVPNFVVTKITEKSPNTILNKSNPMKLSIDSHASNAVKPIRVTMNKQDDIERTKRIIELQRQKSLQIFNTFAPKSVRNLDSARQKLAHTKSTLFDGKNFHVKSMSMSNKNSIGNDEFTEPSKSMTISSKGASSTNQNEPVILNFRTKIHGESPSKSKQLENTTINGRNNANSYRMLEITPVTKNSMEMGIISPKTNERFMANRPLPNSTVKKSVKPQVMSVIRNYSRYPSIARNADYQWRTKLGRSRAPISKKYPSMTNLSTETQLQKNFLRHNIVNRSNIDSPTNLKRYNSCFVLGAKNSDTDFDENLEKSSELSKLYELCSNVVNKLCYKGQIVRRKRGRPKKKIYKSLTKDLLNLPEFSWKVDIQRIKEWRSDGQNPFNTNRRRSKRCALLSIEPILPDISNICKSRDRSPVSLFHINRAPIKTYSRANMIQPKVTLDNKRFEIAKYTAKPQVQLLNIEPLSSTSQIDLEDDMKEEVSQSTEYIIDSMYNMEEYDLSDAIYVEYLEDNDEIESPAYEPITSESNPTTSPIITGEADTTVDNYTQYHTGIERIRPKKPLSVTHNFTATTSVNEKGSPQIEIKYLNTNESDAHSTTDSMTEFITVCEEEILEDFSGPLPIQKKTELTMSPVRKSTRKRKIPSEFPNFAKKVRS